MVSSSKPPVDLSMAVRKHSDPTVESKICVVCPRRKGKPTEKSTRTTPAIALSLDFLRQFFKKPITQVSEELGLSVTAIKKACREFGVPKWPCRTLTSKTSRNRASFENPPSAQAGASNCPPLKDVKRSEAADDVPHSSALMSKDTENLKQDAEMIKEVAVLAAAREERETSPVADIEELDAARNLSILSASARMDNKARSIYHDFLNEVEKYLQGLQGSVRVAELGKRVPKPTEIHAVYPHFSGALRDDPQQRFQCFGSGNTVSIQLRGSAARPAEESAPSAPSTSKRGADPRRDAQDGAILRVQPRESRAALAVTNIGLAAVAASRGPRLGSRHIPRAPIIVTPSRT